MWNVSSVSLKLVFMQWICFFFFFFIIISNNLGLIIEYDHIFVCICKWVQLSAFSITNTYIITISITKIAYDHMNDCIKIARKYSLDVHLYLINFCSQLKWRWLPKQIYLSNISKHKIVHNTASLAEFVVVEAVSHPQHMLQAFRWCKLSI